MSAQKSSKSVGRSSNAEMMSSMFPQSRRRMAWDASRERFSLSSRHGTITCPFRRRARTRSYASNGFLPRSFQPSRRMSVRSLMTWKSLVRRSLVPSFFALRHCGYPIANEPTSSGWRSTPTRTENGIRTEYCRPTVSRRIA